MRKNLFVSFEGGEGTGKSTQVQLLMRYLQKRGHKVVVTREPGGSDLAEKIRQILLSGQAQSYGGAMEALLFAAARADHVRKIVMPALQAGKSVICDRFLDSSRVYQGLDETVDKEFVEKLQKIATGGVLPDLTFILDLEASIGLARAEARRNADQHPDRFEQEDIDRHERRRQAFLRIAQQEPKRCRVVDAGLPIDIIAAEIQGHLTRFLESEVTARDQALTS